ncbi:hypothetical protein Lal_00046382 [Lupinus albus]|nr:hypothetical protein Lal_00046382 [Lupinus albus]
MKNIGLIILVQCSFLIHLCEEIELEDRKYHAFTTRWTIVQGKKIKNPPETKGFRRDVVDGVHDNGAGFCDFNVSRLKPKGSVQMSWTGSMTLEQVLRLQRL